MILSDYIKSLRAQFEEIRDEKRSSANTATRIGNAFLALLSLFGEAVNGAFIKKDEDDTTNGIVTFVKGIIARAVSFFTGIRNEGDIENTGNISNQGDITNGGDLTSSDFEKGLLDGTGYGIYSDASGKKVLEIDKLLVRLKMIIQELEVRKLSYVGGDQVHSSAGSHIAMVRQLPHGDYRCYILADDGTTRTINGWKVGDQARCKTDNIKAGVYKDVSNRNYWRLVVATGDETVDGKVYHYVDLSDTQGTVTLSIDGKEHTCIGMDPSVENDAPQAEDDIVQLGSQTDSDRQYAYIIYVSENKRVDYTGINDYDLASHESEKHSAAGGFIRSNNFVIEGWGGVSAPLVCERGQWDSGSSYGHYDHVSHNGSTWLCIVAKGKLTSSEPAEDNPEWIKEVAKGESGGTGYRVEGFASAGSSVYSEDQTDWKATYTIRVWYDEEEITATLPATRFVWERVSAYPDGDTAWNARHINDGNTLSVTYDDLNGDTSFICHFMDVSGKKKIASIRQNI